MPSRHQSLTIQQAAFTQAGAGSLDLVTGVVGCFIHVVAVFLTMGASGTGVKFQEAGSTDLTGVLAVAANGLLPLAADGREPILSTKTAAAKLNLVSVGGPATGWIRYFTSVEP